MLARVVGPSPFWPEEELAEEEFWQLHLLGTRPDPPPSICVREICLDFHPTDKSLHFQRLSAGHGNPADTKFNTTTCLLSVLHVVILRRPKLNYLFLNP